MEGRIQYSVRKNSRKSSIKLSLIKQSHRIYSGDGADTLHTENTVFYSIVANDFDTDNDSIVLRSSFRLSNLRIKTEGNSVIIYGSSQDLVSNEITRSDIVVIKNLSQDERDSLTERFLDFKINGNNERFKAN